MRFLLINLNWPVLISKKTHKVHLTLPPLDLINLANLATSRGHKAQVLDLFVENGTRLRDLAAEADWIIAATTPYHMWQCPNSDWEWIKRALMILPLSKTVLSGLHGSVFPEAVLRETSVAAVIRREPEGVFAEFLDRQQWQECRGISFLNGSDYCENPEAPLLSLDSLTLNNYFVDLRRYFYFLLGSRTGVFESSRGCPWKCLFCDQEMFGWKYRKKSPAAFASEVWHIASASGMRTAYFYDLEFTVDRRRTLEICRELISYGVPKLLSWTCQTRADMVDEESLLALKEAGCRMIHFGVESANPSTLQAMNKRTSPEKIARGVRLAKEMGFATTCFFMFGFPKESPDDFEMTIEFARHLNPTYASFHFAIPFPGTPLYDRYLADHANESLGCWPAAYFTDWDAQKRANFIRSAYCRFYLSPKKVEVTEFLRRVAHLPQKLRYFFSL